MPFVRPTLTQIYARAIATVNSKLDGADANLRFAILNILSLVLAEMANGLYNYLDFIVLQLFEDTAEDQYLFRRGAIRGLPKKAAVRAVLTVLATGANGTVYEIDTQLQRADGVFYKVLATASIVTDNVTLSVECEEFGTIGDCANGTVLTFISPPPGSDAATTVNGTTTPGFDEETTEEYRARLLEYLREPPHGGDADDYVKWARSVEDVRKAWCYPLEDGVGTVVVRFLVEPTMANPYGIPSPSDVTRVTDYINTVRPVTAKSFAVIAPVAVPLDLDIKLLVADNPDIRLAVENELQAMFFRDSEPGGTIYTSRIINAISLAAGEFACELLSPTTNTTNTVNNMSVLGTITWTT